MSCPSEDCSGERAEQCELTAAQRATVDEPEWDDLAVRCSSCGCVYTLGVRGYPTIKGWLGSSIAGLGWKAARNR